MILAQATLISNTDTPNFLTEFCGEAIELEMDGSEVAYYMTIIASTNPLLFP